MNRRFHLFVYGTLRGGGAAGMLSQCVRVRDAAVAGTLYDVRGEHPALLLYGSTWIRGEIWRCPTSLLPRLDDFEGVSRGLFRRVGVQVGDVGCWTYVAGPALAPELTPARRIGSGDWLLRA